MGLGLDDEVEGKICEMRLLISTKELEWFKKEFPNINWQAGDTLVRWNANKPEEVALAKLAYEAYKKKHPQAQAFRVSKDDTKETQELKEFDPNSEYIIIQDWLHKG